MTGSLPRLHWQFQKVFKWGILLLKTCVCVCVCVCARVCVCVTPLCLTLQPHGL